MCGVCGRGMHRSQDLRTCAPCPLGTFRGAPGLVTECTFCQEGKYGATEGATGCTACPAGHVSQVRDKRQFIFLPGRN